MEILSLGEKIKQRRKELDLTLKNLAGDRITAGQISLIESGKSNPSMDLLEYLANQLKISVEHLMETEETQADKICMYYEDMAEVGIINGDLESANKSLEASYDYIKKYGLKLRKAKNLYLSALICIEEEKYDEAQEMLLSANNIYIKNSCYYEVISVFLVLGKITYKLGAYHSAYSYFQQAEKVFEESNVYDETLMGQVYYYISKTLDKLGLENKAVEYLSYAEKSTRILSHHSEYGREILKRGTESFENGNLNQALEYSNRSLRYFKFKDYLTVKTELYSGLGNLQSQYGYIDKSFKSLELAKRFDSIVEENYMIDTLITKCNNYIKLKDEENAKGVLEEISSKLQGMKSNDGTLVCKYHMLKYRTKLLEKKYEEAERILIDTLSYTSKMGYKHEEAQVAITLGKFYMELGKEEEANKYLDYGVNILEEIKSITDF